MHPGALCRVPHLRDGLIVAKVGHFRGSENPDTPNSPMAGGPYIETTHTLGCPIHAASSHGWDIRAKARAVLPQPT
jgi:hypothetical protein